MATLSLAALWRDTFADARALMPLALPVAAAFVLLPGVAIDAFGPPQPKTIAEMTPNVVLIELIVPALIGLVAQGAVMRLTLDRRAGVARSVGEALARTLRLWPLLVAALVLTVLPIGAGLALFVVPGIYVAGRLALVVPLVVDGTGPTTAVERSWTLTTGNGWRVAGFTMMIVGWFFIAATIATTVGTAVVILLGKVGLGSLSGFVGSVIAGSVSMLFTVVNAVAVATVYRHLAAR